MLHDKHVPGLFQNGVVRQSTGYSPESNLHPCLESQYPGFANRRLIPLCPPMGFPEREGYPGDNRHEPV